MPNIVEVSVTPPPFRDHFTFVLGTKGQEVNTNDDLEIAASQCKMSPMPSLWIKQKYNAC
jgi:hypothetical protein